MAEQKVVTKVVGKVGMRGEKMVVSMVVLMVEWRGMRLVERLVVKTAGQLAG